MKRHKEKIMIMPKLCPTCEKGCLLSVDDITSTFSGQVFIEKGERCNECGEEFPYHEESQKTIQTARKLAIWPDTF